MHTNVTYGNLQERTKIDALGEKYEISIKTLTISSSRKYIRAFILSIFVHSICKYGPHEITDSATTP